MSTIDCDIAIVGAGLLGLATAIQLLRREPSLEVIVVEAEDRVGRHQSGHNSGVVHAGVYYAPGSLKARLCREGRAELIEFAADHEIAFRADGKLIVAASAQELSGLDRLHERATRNGLRGLRLLGVEEMRELEPSVAGVAALHVPESGVIDFGLVAEAYASEVAALGGAMLLGWPVDRIADSGGRWQLDAPAGGLRARFLITCAGLFADRLLELSGVRDREHRTVPFRGSYRALAPARIGLVRSMVYPVPDPRLPFLGVHFTRGIDGEVHVGPNALPVSGRSGDDRQSLRWSEIARTLAFPGTARLARDYAGVALGELWRDLSPSAYLAAARVYIPELRPDDLLPGGSGVRAQCVRRDGRLVDDFLFHEASGSLHVLNAPSPAATASLAIGRTVAERALTAFRRSG